MARILLLAALVVAALGGSAWAQDNPIVRFAPQGIQTNDYLLRFVPEGAGLVELPVQRLGDLTGAVQLGYLVTGDTAEVGYDFSSVIGPVRFEPGETLQWVPLQLLMDDLLEPTEYLDVWLTNAGPGVLIASPRRVRVGIMDTTGGCRFVSNVVSVLENVGQVVLPVVRSARLEEAVTISYATQDGSAVAGKDYTAVSGNLTFGVGEQSKTIEVPILNDAVLESEEFFLVALSDATGGALLDTPSAAKVLIADNDPGVRLQQGSYEVSEGSGELTVWVECGTDPEARPVTVRYATLDGSAVAGKDYTAASGTLTFGVGEELKQITIPILNDGRREEAESFRLTLSQVSSGVSLGYPATATILIEDNDPGVRLSEYDYWVSESAGTMTVGIDRGNDSDLEAFSVNYATSDGAATAGTDYTAASGTLTFGVGETNKTITIPILNDGLRESEESFQLTLSQVSGGASLGEPSTATIRIGDNDLGVRFNQYSYDVSENSGLLTVWVERGNDFDAGPFTVNYATSDGTAVAGTDYTATSGTLTFGLGEQTKTIAIPILNDGLREWEKSFRLTLSQVSGGLNLGEPSTATIQIIDNDPGVGFNPDGYSASENGGAVTVWVDRGNDFDSGPFTVSYGTSDGTAMAGTDYTATSGTLTFNAGEQRKSITIPILNDGLRESTEIFTLMLGQVTGGVSLAEHVMAYIEISDNDPGVRLDRYEYAIAENGGTIMVGVDRGNDVELGSFTVDYSASDGTATTGLDYTAVSGTLTFKAGEQSKTIAIPILNDGLREQAEYFRLTLSQVSGGASPGDPTAANIWISDNDPGVRLGSSDYAVSENGGTVMVWVDRGNDFDTVPFTVNYATSGGTATPGADYTATSGTLTFAAGEQTKSIAIPILNDGLRESEETFQLTLSQASGGPGQGEPSTATIRIGDNDPGVRLSQSDYWVSENGGAVMVWVERGNDVETSPFTVSYATSGGSATVGVDYTATSGTLTFGVGEQSKTITIPILNDGLREQAEYFRLTLSQVSGAASLGEPTTATIRIGDNDPGVGFKEGSWEVGEGAGTVAVTVVRGNDVELSPMQVDYVLVDDTARAGLDYVAGSGRLEFGQGETEKSFAVTVLDDRAWEGDELIRVVLTNHVGSGSMSGAPEAWARILDDDPVSWERVSGFAEAYGFRDVGWGGERWVIPYERPGVLWSTNGWDWQREETAEIMERVAYGGGRFVGVSGNGAVYGSTNGVVWESLGTVSGMSVYPEGLVYGGGQFVLATGEPKVWVSTNGLDWVEGGLPGGVGYVRGLSYGAGRYVLVSETGWAMVSTNGLEWDAVSVVQGALWGAAYGEGRFVAVGERPGSQGETERLVAESVDGEGWVVQVVTNGLYGGQLEYGEGRFVVVGSGIWVLERGGGGWEARQVSSMEVSRVQYGGGRFVGVTWDGIRVSEEGLVWGAPTANYRSVVFGDGEFVVMADSQYGWWSSSYAILSSPDGRSWVPRASGDGWARGLARGSGVYVAAAGGSGVQPDSQFLRSTNGVDWVEVAAGLGDTETRHSYVNGLGYGVGRFVAVGRQYDDLGGGEVGMVWTSADGLAWEGRALVWPGSLSWVSAWPEEVVVRGDNYNFGPVAFGTVDGTNWVSVPLDQMEPQLTVQSVWPLEAGVGDGWVWLRRKGQAWTGYDLPGAGWPVGLAYGPGWLLAVGDRGTVWVSSPLVGVEFLGWTPEGELRLVITGPAGARYEVERSVDLGSWDVVGEVTTAGIRHEALVADAGGGVAWFYRVVLK